MEITVDGVLFTVKERIRIGEYEGLLVTSQKRSVFSMSATMMADTLLFVRSNSWGGMFRLCLQDSGGGGYFKKGADYTRSTFAKMELQIHFFNCWDRMRVTKVEPMENKYCIDATDLYPNKKEDALRTVKCPIGRPDYTTLQKIGNYKYNYEVDNVTLCEMSKMDEYLDLPEDQRRKYNPNLKCIPNTTQDIRRDPQNAFESTRVHLTGNIFRVSIPGTCPTYFYYSLVNIKTTTAKDENPISLSDVDETDKMIPLITIPQVQVLNRDCELLGIYSQYAENNSSSIAKVMEYVQACEKPGKRCTNSYVVNDEYDAPLFAEVKTHTLRQRRSRHTQKFKRLKQTLGLHLGKSSKRKSLKRKRSASRSATELTT